MRLISKSSSVSPEALDLSAAAITAMDHGVMIQIKRDPFGGIQIKQAGKEGRTTVENADAAMTHIMELLGVKSNPGIVNNYNAWRHRIDSKSPISLVKAWPFLGPILSV